VGDKSGDPLDVPHPVRLEPDSTRQTREAEKQMKIKVVFSLLTFAARLHKLTEAVFTVGN
jgi:hypothetical protein